ncbi:MAG: CYTH domain-containing protein [Thermodesulfobacteriota bacterium]
MSVEIERKFIVIRPPDNLKNYKSEEINQGYIVISEDIEVRLRKKGNKFYQTVKSTGDLKRNEVEIELSEKQFEKLWPLTAGKRLEKVRYEIPNGNNLIELDIYCGLLNALVTAEVEFETEQESKTFLPPTWFGKDVTRDNRYKNKNLSLKGLPKEI